MSAPREAILLHGAWAGGWVWDSQRPALAAAGWRCAAPDLPAGAGATFEDQRAMAAALLRGCAGPATLVAHSGAGVLASQLAQDFPDRVARIVYVCGMMLPSGVSFPELLAPLLAADPAAIGIGAHLEAVPGGSRVPAAAALEIFFHDAPPAAAQAAAARLRPWPEAARAPVAVLTPDRFGRIARAYVVCEADRSVVPAAQRAMLARSPGARVASLPCGHAPMLSAPALLSATLRDLMG